VQELIGTERVLEGAAEMQAFGERIAGLLTSGDTLLLHGDLGAGKTTLAQGIARGLGVAASVTSPTFTLVAEYPVANHPGGIGTLFHLDLYRLTDPEELDGFGFDEFLSPDSAVSLIEWPERAPGRFPLDAVLIELESAGPDARRVRIRRLGGASAPRA
jgi:tRNA threonylcarbamoyladenosine biosynthesis protein TsaE